MNKNRIILIIIYILLIALYFLFVETANNEKDVKFENSILKIELQSAGDTIYDLNLRIEELENELKK